MWSGGTISARVSRGGETPSGSAGLRLLLPGWAQWHRGQQRRAAALAGMYASAVVVGLFGWGSTPGFALIGLAVWLHVWSSADAIRGSSFPGYGRWVPWLASSVGIGGLGYLPLLAMAMQAAYPASVGGTTYLVDRSAFGERGPRAGNWVWLDRVEAEPDRAVALVIAEAGQVVSWSELGLRVDGDRLDLPIESEGGDAPLTCVFEVPDDCLLVAVGDEAIGGSVRADSIAIVSADRTLGRPWVRYQPIWRRDLLS